MNGSAASASASPPPADLPQLVAQADLRTMIAEMKAQRLEGQVAELTSQNAELQGSLDAANGLVSLFSVGGHWAQPWDDARCAAELASVCCFEPPLFFEVSTEVSGVLLKILCKFL